MDFNVPDKFKNSKGIYFILNKINSKKYFGQTKDFQARFRRHKSQLENNNHYNLHLQASFNKYGSDNFSFNFYKLSNYLSIDERKAINLYNTFLDENAGYNLTEGGGTTSPHISKRDFYRMHVIKDGLIVYRVYKNGKRSKPIFESTDKSFIDKITSDLNNNRISVDDLVFNHKYHVYSWYRKDRDKIVYRIYGIKEHKRLIFSTDKSKVEALCYQLNLGLIDESDVPIILKDYFPLSIGKQGVRYHKKIIYNGRYNQFLFNLLYFDLIDYPLKWTISNMSLRLLSFLYNSWMCDIDFMDFVENSLIIRRINTELFFYRDLNKCENANHLRDFVSQVILIDNPDNFSKSYLENIMYESWLKNNYGLSYDEFIKTTPCIISRNGRFSIRINFKTIYDIEKIMNYFNNSYILE